MVYGNQGSTRGIGAFSVLYGFHKGYGFRGLSRVQRTFRFWDIRPGAAGRKKPAGS